MNTPDPQLNPQYRAQMIAVNDDSRDMHAITYRMRPYSIEVARRR